MSRRFVTKLRGSHALYIVVTIIKNEKFLLQLECGKFNFRHSLKFLKQFRDLYHCSHPPALFFESVFNSTRQHSVPFLSFLTEFISLFYGFSSPSININIDYSFRLSHAFQPSSFWWKRMILITNNDGHVKSNDFFLFFLTMTPVYLLPEFKQEC